MRRSQQSAMYAVGSLIGNSFNIYLHGTTILSIFSVIIGVITSGTVDGAIAFLLDFYIVKLLPWPLDEAYLAQTVADFIISHAVTIGVGIVSATYRYHREI